MLYISFCSSLLPTQEVVTEAGIDVKLDKTNNTADPVEP